MGPKGLKRNLVWGRFGPINRGIPKNLGALNLGRKAWDLGPLGEIKGGEHGILNPPIEGEKGPTFGEVTPLFWLFGQRGP